MVDAADIITNLTPHNSSQSLEQDNLPMDGSCKSIPQVYASASDSPSEFSGYKLPGNQLDPLRNTNGGQCKNFTKTIAFPSLVMDFRLYIAYNS